MSQLESLRNDSTHKNKHVDTQTHTILLSYNLYVSLSFLLRHFAYSPSLSLLFSTPLFLHTHIHTNTLLSPRDDASGLYGWRKKKCWNVGNEEKSVKKSEQVKKEDETGAAFQTAQYEPATASSYKLSLPTSKFAFNFKVNNIWL